MSDITNVGKKMSELRTSPPFQPFTRVVLWYDDENAFSAGDETGRTLEADCPWATQAMANNVLNAIQGFVYKPYEAEDALLDPAAEIGDGIGVNSIYSILASADTTFDALCASNISAPSDEETDNEYPFVSPIQRELERKVTLGANYYGTKITRQNGLKITKTNGEDEMSRVILNSDQLVFYDGDGNEALYFDTTTGKYTFNGTVMVGGSINIGDGNFTVDENGNVHIPNGSISFSQLNSSTQGIINDASEDASDAYDFASAAWQDLVALADGQLSGGTFINGQAIYSPTIYAGIIYAARNDTSDYAQMTAEGFSIYKGNNLKCLIGENPNTSWTNQAVILGASTPLYVEKYWTGSYHYGWVGNGAINCGIRFNFTNGTYKIFGTPEA